MTPNSEKVLNFLKDHYGQEFSKQQLADELDGWPYVEGEVRIPIATFQFAL